MRVGVGHSTVNLVIKTSQRPFFKVLLCVNVVGIYVWDITHCS